MLGIKLNTRLNHIAALEQLNILQKSTIAKEIKQKIIRFFGHKNKNHTFGHENPNNTSDIFYNNYNFRPLTNKTEDKKDFSFEDLHSGITLENAISYRSGQTVYIENNSKLDEYIFVRLINKDMAIVKSCCLGYSLRVKLNLLKTSCDINVHGTDKQDCIQSEEKNTKLNNNIDENYLVKGNIVIIDFFGQSRDFIIDEKLSDGKVKLSNKSLNYFIIVPPSKILEIMPAKGPILVKGDLVCVNQNGKEQIYEFDRFERDNRAFVKDLVTNSFYLFCIDDISKYNK